MHNKEDDQVEKTLRAVHFVENITQSSPVLYFGLYASKQTQNEWRINSQW